MAITMKEVPSDQLPWKAYDENGKLIFEGKDKSEVRIRAEQELKYKSENKNSIHPGMRGKYRGKDMVVDDVEGNYLKIIQGGEVKLVEKADVDENTEWYPDNKNSIVTAEDRRAKGQELFGTKKNDREPYTKYKVGQKVFVPGDGNEGLQKAIVTAYEPGARFIDVKLDVDGTPMNFHITDVSLA